MKNKNYRYVILVFLVEVILLVFIMVAYKPQSKALYSGNVYEFNDNWTLTIDGEEKTVIDKLPYKCDSKAHSEVILSNIVPAQYAGLTMYFYTTDKPVWVYVDDVCVYQFGVTDKHWFGTSPGAFMNYVDIPRELKEGRISIVTKADFDNVGTVFAEIKIAQRDVAVLRLVIDNLFELGCSIILFMVGFIFAVIGLTSYIFKEDVEGTFYMTVFSFIVGVYFLIQSRLLYIFCGNAYVYMYVNFTFLMNMPILMAGYYKANIDKKYSKRLSVIIVIGMVNIFLQQGAYILGLADYWNMIYLSHFIIAIGAIVTIISLIEMIKTPRKRFALFSLLGIVIVFSGSIIDIIRSYRVISPDMGKYSRITTIFYCVSLQVYHLSNLLRRYSKRLRENAMLLQHENMELVKAKDEAEVAKQEAIMANSAKNNFLARISHEIRTPINAVLGMDNMILRESSEESIKGYAIDIKNAGNTLLSLINDILDFSKMESGNLEIIPAEYEISSMFHDIIKMIEPRIKSKNLEFNISIDENIPSRLFGDDVRVRQIIINILTNAVKYTEKGSVSFTVKCENVDSSKIRLCVDVTDTGIGIKEEDLQNITVAFKRIEESRNRHIEGTGLGMSITVSLLSMMGSELNVKSEYGKGSSFGFELEQGIVDSTPIGDFEERIKSKMSDIKYTASVYAPKASILVVDDNVVNLKVFKGLLKHTGVKITELESGLETLDAIQKEHFDIIFLDHMMPQLDGIETLQRMKEMDHMCKDTPVIVLTANAVVGAKEMYLEKGFNDFLSKPIIPEKLEQMLNNFLPDELKQDVRSIPKIETKDEINIEEFPQIEGIDWKYASEHFTSTEFLIDAVTNLYNTIENDMELLSKYYEDIENEENLDQYRIKVHAMKSTTALIGAISLSGLAKLLEFAARDHEIETIKHLSPIFIKECVKLKENLDAHKPKENKVATDNTLLITLFTQIKKKVEKLDIDGMDNIVSEINKYDLSVIEDEMKKLLNDVSNIDMEQIVADSDKIIEMLK